MFDGLPGGQPAATIDALARVVGVGAALILLVVVLLALWALRASPWQARAAQRLPLVGAGVSAALLLALFAYTAAATGDEDAPAAAQDELVVGVTGHQWWWSLRYRDPADGAEIVAANELHLPVGRAIRLALTADDVIHSFWVPALAGKRDLLPGVVTHLRLRIERPGLYAGQCAEFCGEQHARMALRVVALPADEFARWLAAQRRDAAAPRDALQQRGRDAFLASGCAACHVVRGVTPLADALRPTRAPDLTHLASRARLAAGALPNDARHLAAWIEDAQAFKPGARMASYAHLDAATREALVAWLSQLR